MSKFILQFTPFVLLTLSACRTADKLPSDSGDSGTADTADTDGSGPDTGDTGGNNTGTDTGGNDTGGTDTSDAAKTHPCLVAHWPFDEGSGTTTVDASGNGNDGVLQGGAAWTAGATGNAVQLAGKTDFVEFGDILSSVSLPVTISAWVWIDGDSNFEIVNTDVDDARYYGVWLQVSPNNTFSASYGDGTGGNGSQYRRSVTSTDGVPRQTWIHLAAVVRGAEDMELYVDGARVTGTYDGTGGRFARSTGSFGVGHGLSDGRVAYAEGAIDEVRVYDCDLDAAEIAKIAVR